MIQSGYINPENGLVLWCVNRGKERWVSPEKYFAYVRQSRECGRRYRFLRQKGCGRGHKPGYFRHSEESRAKMSAHWMAKYGNNLPGWSREKVKVVKMVRSLTEYIEWRKRVFERDSFRCVCCGKDGYITAHHVKSASKIVAENCINSLESARNCAQLWDINNGKTLCEDCHKLTDNYKGRGKR